MVDSSKERPEVKPRRRAPLQVKNFPGGKRLNHSVDAMLSFAAWQGYAVVFGSDQTSARMHERGGFDLTELGFCLAVAVDEGLIEVRLTDKAQGMAGVWYRDRAGARVYHHPDGSLHASAPATDPKALLKQLRYLESHVDSVIRERRVRVTPAQVQAYLLAKGWAANDIGRYSPEGPVKPGFVGIGLTEGWGLGDDEWVVGQIASHEQRDDDQVRLDIAQHAKETEGLLVGDDSA